MSHRFSTGICLIVFDDAQSIDERFETVFMMDLTIFFCLVFDSLSSVYFYVLISLAHIPYRVMMVLLIVDDYKNN